MRSWSDVEVPALPVRGPQVRVHDTSSGDLVGTVPDDRAASLYVCGITPYDATHLGHANTYVTFDLLNRAWRNAGHEVHYAQNVTDVDDPLLERADATGEDWIALAERETNLFRTDMEALRVIPPEAYVGVTESIPVVVEMIRRLDEAGAVYRVEDDYYFDVHADADFGEVSGWTEAEMLRIYPERGGDPDRPGKRHPLDCLLWRAERPGEPAWDTELGRGRPGWHVECSAIARDRLGTPIDVQGGGSDLIFPHHEMSAGQAQVVDGHRFARAYMHGGMVGLDGEKMSKSKGNLELVSRLRLQGADPMAIRMALLRHHYRDDWEWTPEQLVEAEAALARIREAASRPAGPATKELVAGVLSDLADDLHADRALDRLDAWAAGSSEVETGAGDVVRRLADAALGLKI